MIFLKLSLRRLFRRETLSVISIIGLTIALCSTLFLLYYIVQEQSYDKHIPNHERIFRLISIWKEGGKTENLPINLSENILQLKENIPEVEEVVQIYRGGDSYFEVEDHVITDNPTFEVDKNFFKVFQFKTVYGELEGALDSPEKVVVSQKTAQKVFGNRNPVGEKVTVDGKLSTITAVLENIPDNTHFYFDVLKPVPTNVRAYGGLEFFTYILLGKNVDYEKALDKCEQRTIETLNERFDDFDFVAEAKLEPIADIHLKTIADFDFKENGNLTLVIFLIVLSVIILIIALTNHINLFMAQKEHFSKHIAIHKVFGSTYMQTVWLIFGESLIIVVISFVAALILFVSVKSQVADYIGIHFIPDLWDTPALYLLFAGLLIVSTLFAGLYPAIAISRKKMRPGRYGASGTSRKKTKRQLLVFQFSLVSFMIIGILTVNTQIRYIENKPKGFSSENIINYDRITYALQDRWSALATELRAIPHVVEVTGSHSYPGKGGSGQGIKYNASPVLSIGEARVQPGYLKVFGIQLEEGRFFDGPELEKKAVVLNRTAIEELGIQNPVGKILDFKGHDVEIIGVVKDYNYESLKSRIAPLMLTNYKNDVYTVSIKTDGTNTSEIVKNANAIFKKFDSGYQIFYDHFQDELMRMYASEHALRRIFYLGTSLGILIALVGLLAFVALITRQRIKEIGIRKVNGAKVSEIVTMFNKDFLKWVIIAFVIACPIAYYVMNRWLENFAYKTVMSWWIFAFAGLAVFCIAMFTVSWQSFKAARVNPVETLRDE